MHPAQQSTPAAFESEDPLAPAVQVNISLLNPNTNKTPALQAAVPIHTRHKLPAHKMPAHASSAPIKTTHFSAALY
jgi:hypothetical protein